MNAKKAKQLRRLAREASTPDAFPIAYAQDGRRGNFVVAIDSTRGLYRAAKVAARQEARKAQIKKPGRSRA